MTRYDIAQGKQPSEADQLWDIATRSWPILEYISKEMVKLTKKQQESINTKLQEPGKLKLQQITGVQR